MKLEFCGKVSGVRHKVMGQSRRTVLIVFLESFLKCTSDVLM